MASLSVKRPKKDYCEHDVHISNRCEHCGTPSRRDREKLKKIEKRIIQEAAEREAIVQGLKDHEQTMMTLQQDAHQQQIKLDLLNAQIDETKNMLCVAEANMRSAEQTLLSMREMEEALLFKCDQDDLDQIKPHKNMDVGVMLTRNLQEDVTLTELVTAEIHKECVYLRNRIAVIENTAITMPLQPNPKPQQPLLQQGIVITAPPVDSKPKLPNDYNVKKLQPRHPQQYQQYQTLFKFKPIEKARMASAQAHQHLNRPKLDEDDENDEIDIMTLDDTTPFWILAQKHEQDIDNIKTALQTNDSNVFKYIQILDLELRFDPSVKDYDTDVLISVLTSRPDVLLSPLTRMLSNEFIETQLMLIPSHSYGYCVLREMLEAYKALLRSSNHDTSLFMKNKHALQDYFSQWNCETAVIRFANAQGLTIDKLLNENTFETLVALMFPELNLIKPQNNTVVIPIHHFKLSPSSPSSTVVAAVDPLNPCELNIGLTQLIALKAKRQTEYLKTQSTWITKVALIRKSIESCETTLTSLQSSVVATKTRRLNVWKSIVGLRKDKLMETRSTIIERLSSTKLGLARVHWGQSIEELKHLECILHALDDFIIDGIK